MLNLLTIYAPAPFRLSLSLPCSDGSFFVVLLWEETGVPDENPLIRPGDHVTSPGVEPETQ